MSARRYSRPVLAFWTGLLCIASAGVATLYGTAEPRVSAISVRAAARAAGLDSLTTIKAPQPANLFEFVRDTPDGHSAVRQLGKALFWDMQVGSDGQACASCHFHAGADNRVKNQLNPGVNAGDKTFGNIGAGIDARAGHPSFGPNHVLKPIDFPLHVIDPCAPSDFSRRTVLNDTNDVVSSQGVLGATLVPHVSGETQKFDRVFNVSGTSVRRTAPRNAPSVINAVFNVDNFWDGRAKSDFNGSSVLGPLDPNAGVFEEDAIQNLLVRRRVSIDHASLASQALSPPLSNVEMSFEALTFAHIARKLLSVRPLGLQLVSPRDSVLGSLARARSSGNRVAGELGLNTSYDMLIKRAFQPRWWASALRTDGFTQMEANFGLFFGLAIRAYESMLVSDRTAFDRFMEGDDEALTDEQLRGLLSFIHTPFSSGKAFRAPFSGVDVFDGVGRGSCVLCHAGPEFTAAAVTSEKKGRFGVSTTARLVEGKLIEDKAAGAYSERGFINIGVRPTEEDKGRGATIFHPLSFARAAVARLPFGGSVPECGRADRAPCPINNRDLVDGAFKIPTLRNVELTGPYFHNGGQATLKQVLEFYRRQGDFADRNVASMSPLLTFVEFGAIDGARMVKFLGSLTDERVRQEQAPFDHPQLFVPNGSPGDSLELACSGGNATCESREEIPAVGAGGRVAAGLPPLVPFLRLDLQSDTRRQECR